MSISQLPAHVDNAGIDAVLNYQKSSDISQLVTVGAADTTVTLSNPHQIQNNTNSAGNIAFRLYNDTAFRTVYFGAGAVLNKKVAEVGGSVSGTTVSTVVVYGTK